MPGGVRLSGGPVLSETEHSTWESEVSSVLSIGDRIVLSDTEDELVDKQKYCLPDVGKTRLDLHTKEPLSPTARQVLRSPLRSPSKRSMTTPTEAPLRGSPLRREHSWGSARWNASAENLGPSSDGEHMASDMSRAGSIYSLSRVSFAGQLSQLTNIRLPDATSLARRISSIPTSSEAARSLADASEQIRLWIGKASEVLQGLNADDDVEWAAAGGRDGIEEVDQAISRFEKLVDVYVQSIERLQTRDDVASLSAAELTGSVKQMEAIIASWRQIKDTLKNTKTQVEMALEWEQLWNTVLGEIAQELEALNRHIFEMEEKRHEGAATLFGSRDHIDLHALEAIVEEQPGRAWRNSQILNMTTPPLLSPGLPLQTTAFPDTKEDESSLLSLFARMQPLRAQLDFLPMRLSTFTIRGKTSLPTARQELEDRRTELEKKWKKLEADADGLRRELGEDKWTIVFKNAGRQAMKMCESITRSYNKLLDGLDAGEQTTNTIAITKKAESYEQKKVHYSPAVERVLAIVDRGISERLTVNGEILRLQADMKQKWTQLQANMKEMDSVLEEVNNEAKGRQLRDSVSTVMSSERSLGSSLVETPTSSPASSVIGGSRKNSFQGSRTPTPMISTKSIPVLITPSTGRSSVYAPSTSSIPRRALLNRHSVVDLRGSPSPAPSTTVQWPSRPPLKQDNRPRWNTSVKSSQRDFTSLAAHEPSPYAKSSVTPKAPTVRAGSAMRNTPPGHRVVSEPVKPVSKLSFSTSTADRKSSLPVPASPSVRAASALGYKTAASGRRSRLSTILAQVSDGNEADNESPSRRVSSPLERNGRRSSMLPLRGRTDELTPARAGAERPAWR
ncbi:hypothetical protein AMS68_001807 [Peltaster fructicola]|uniref:Karyogamy protein n=1 Tax=Peltaster fructicola TaxID=286661 RepID=A0A6H0XP76_9PEZI|nr:hypothetical protein AMS68_001807 [Peltaster fructicola]